MQYGLFGVNNVIMGVTVNCGKLQNNTQDSTSLEIMSGFLSEYSKPLHAIDWKECGQGRFSCGIRTKLNSQSHITGVEFKCCAYG